MKWIYLIIIVLTLFLFIGGPGYHSNQLYKEIWDTGHATLFAAAVFVLLRLSVFKKKNPWISLCYITLFCLVAGIITETLQLAVGRSFEIKDLSNDLSGGYLGWAISTAIHTDHRKSVRILMIPVILSILLVILNPVYRAAYNAAFIERQFPVLSDFETPYELDYWNAHLAAIHPDASRVRHGKKSMRIDLDPGTYPGISLETFRHDWRGYSKLQFGLYNTTTHTITINLKIFDRQHTEGGYEFRDRFNRGLTMKPGWNDYNVALTDIQAAPQDRPMDLSNIESFSLFLSRLDQPMTLYFDNLRLSRE